MPRAEGCKPPALAAPLSNNNQTTTSAKRRAGVALRPPHDKLANVNGERRRRDTRLDP
ncbi:MAG: hypothetical protein LBE74_06605 [Treponema sp.]|nr:hypothetical protein [Treponema sp.]